MRFRGWGRRGPAPLFPPIYGPPPGTTPTGPVFACRPVSFDLALCEASFPRIKELDDTDLAQVLHIVFALYFVTQKLCFYSLSNKWDILIF